MQTNAIINRPVRVLPSARPRSADTTSDSRGWGVLLVEDEPSIRYMLEHFLRRCGYTVFSSGDGEEALDVFAAHMDEIDIALFDLNMPKLSGNELFWKLKGTKPTLRTVLASGRAEPELVRPLLGGGLDRILPKPFLPRVVADTLEALRLGRPKAA